MSRWKKIEFKLKNLAKTITYEEILVLLYHYGYEIDNKGKTSGSRVKFVNEGHADILLHKPHPEKELKDYAIKDLYEKIEKEGFWNE